MITQPDHIEDLILNVLSGNASPQECTILKSWIEEGSDNRRFFEQQRDAWIASGVIRNAGRFDAGSGFRTFKTRIRPTYRTRESYKNKKNGTRLRTPHLMLMAFFIFCMGAVFYHFISLPAEAIKQQEAVLYYETVVPLGAKSQITLIDGTRVWLNAGSKLRYSTAFAVTDREVQLEGEGYFEVKKNNHLPFNVKTSALNIKAIGTAFNVKAYPGEEVIETILVEGEVEVTHMQRENIEKVTVVSLKPKQRLTLMKNTDEILFESGPPEMKGKEISPRQDDPVVSPVREIEATSDYMVNTSWKDNRWRIEGEELGSLSTKLERRYNVRIVFTDDELKRYRFNGTLEDEPVEAVLKVMAQTAPVKFELNGSEIRLSRNNRFQEKHKDLYGK